MQTKVLPYHIYVPNIEIKSILRSIPPTELTTFIVFTSYPHLCQTNFHKFNYFRYFISEMYQDLILAFIRNFQSKNLISCFGQDFVSVYIVFILRIVEILQLKFVHFLIYNIKYNPSYLPRFPI